MNNRLSIGKRLKELRKKNKFSQSYVAQNLYISQAAYSLIENSQNGIVSEHVIGLSNLYEVTTDFILKGDNMLIRLSPSNGFTPYIKVKAHAGYIQNGTNMDFSDYEWYKIPGYNPTIDHRLFEVEGDSMAPTVFSGDIIICQKHQNWDRILDGTLVLVITKDQLLVKRFRNNPEMDTFQFENDNPELNQTYIIKKEEIKEINLIRGKISSVMVSHHQMVSNEKFKTLEQSVEFLKKELYSITKKLNANNN